MNRLVAAARRRARPLKRLFAGPPKPLRLFGYDRYLRRPGAGRALLSYLPDPVQHELAGGMTDWFSSQGMANALPRALNELGYVVDIISFDDVLFEPRRAYDVLVQHGGINFGGLIAALPADVAVVYFSTGIYWRTANERERERLDAFRRRTGIELPPDRWVGASEDEAIDRADGIVAIGGPRALESYAHVPLVLPLDIAVFPDEHLVHRDLAEARDHFLFFAGYGNLHKGLDLALEAFAELPQHLHVATKLDPEFADHYRGLIDDHPNIHVHGWLEAHGAQFYDLMSRCAFSILPTCSEGQPGSVVECMQAGLVPLVTPEANLEVEGYGFVIDADIEGIRRVAAEVARLPTDELERLSAAARSVAREQHSPERFLETMRRHLQTVLDGAAASRANG